MVVYTNKKGTKFMSVENSDDWDINMDCLIEDGFHFSFQESFKSDLLELIVSLPSSIRKGVANELRSSSYVLEAYSDDEMLETFDDLTFREIGRIINYLDSELDSKCWYSWLVYGCSQGDVSYVWIYSDKGLDIDPNEKFVDDKEADFLGEDWQEILSQVVYWPSVNICECDKFGNINGYGRVVYGYYINGQALPLNESNDYYLDEYMKKNYGMEPAKLNLTTLYMPQVQQTA